MIYTIKITEQADNDIRNIYEYIAYELQSPENASGQLDRIEKCIMSLDYMPERYRFYDRELWKSRGLHIVSVDNYCVLYIVDNGNMTVSIMRVMYGGRDIDVQLDKYTKYEEECKIKICQSSRLGLIINKAKIKTQCTSNNVLEPVGSPAVLLVRVSNLPLRVVRSLLI